MYSEYLRGYFVGLFILNKMSHSHRDYVLINVLKSCDLGEQAITSP